MIEFPFISLSNIKFANRKKISSPPQCGLGHSPRCYKPDSFKWRTGCDASSNDLAVCVVLYLHRRHMPLRHNHREWLCGEERKQILLLGDVSSLFVSQTAGHLHVRIAVGHVRYCYFSSWTFVLSSEPKYRPVSKGSLHKFLQVKVYYEGYTGWFFRY